MINKLRFLSIAFIFSMVDIPTRIKSLCMRGMLEYAYNQNYELSSKTTQDEPFNELDFFNGDPEDLDLFINTFFNWQDGGALTWVVSSYKQADKELVMIAYFGKKIDTLLPSFINAIDALDMSRKLPLQIIIGHANYHPAFRTIGKDSVTKTSDGRVETLNLTTHLHISQPEYYPNSFTQIIGMAPMRVHPWRSPSVIPILSRTGNADIKLIPYIMTADELGQMYDIDDPEKELVKIYANDSTVVALGARPGDIIYSNHMDEDGYETFMIRRVLHAFLRF